MKLALTPIIGINAFRKLSLVTKCQLRSFNLLLLIILTCTLVSGCSTIKVVPEQVVHGVINAVENSQTITENGIEVSVRADESAINAYNLESTVASFHIAIRNISASEVAFSEDSFVLVDEQGLQYSLLTPDKVRDMLKKDSYYLMPYPYVGFYYLEDYQKTSFYNRFNSSLPYYYELYPQDLFSKALPMTTVIPGMKIEGLTYFKVDPAAHQNIKLLIFGKGASKSSPPAFSFPFKILK